MPQPAPMSVFEKEMLVIEKRKMKMNEDALDTKRSDALATAKPLKQLVMELCTELDEELDQTTSAQLQSGDDQLVTKTMLRLAGWKSKMESVRTTHQEFLTTTAVFRLPETEHVAVSAAVERTKESLADIVTIAEDEDEKRQLFSLDTSVRGEQVKWPEFAGDTGEDFFKFKKDFLDAAKQNKTSTRNQITKLRENLSGYAKSLVPNSITDITRGLSILEHACGDSMRVVTHRVNNLLKVGPWPQEGTKDCYTKQIKWIVTVQALLQEIIDLANTEEELADIIYNREKLAQILKLFPSFIVDKLAKLPGYKEPKYLEIITKLDEVKKVTQNRELIYGPGGAQSQAADPRNLTPLKQSKLENIPTGHTFFPQPKQFSDCRICKVLHSQGGSAGLFLNHVSDYATGCPLFASLGTDQRFVIVREAKLCPRCMGKDIVSDKDHYKECPVTKKKNSYSCMSANCTFHMWICSKHTNTNKQQMEKFEEQLRTRSGIRLVFMADTTSLDKPPDLVIPGSSPTYCSMPNTGMTKAVKKMCKLNQKNDPSIETVSPPEGSPLFMFQPIEGLQDPVNLFYDCGCSDAIFRDGIPGKQLHGTLLAKGPFQMGGVGDIATVAEEEWLVQFNRTDNKKQLV